MFLPDEDGYVTEYTYNSRNLAQSISYSDNRGVQFAYNAAGQLTQMTDWNGSTVFALDILGIITSVTDHNNKTVGYAYDANGNKLSLTYPDGGAVNYSYDALNRLTGVLDGANATAYNYDLSGRLTSLTRPDRSMENYGLDAAGQVTGVTDGSNAQINAFTYDPQGNLIEEIRGIAGSAVIFEYSYDTLNRLTGVIEDYGSAERVYEYDSLGNLLLTEINGNRTIEYSYNKRNQLVEKDDGLSAYSYSYDLRGNLILEEDITANSVIKTYVYDAANKMVSGIDVVSGVASTYNYNGLGQLVGKPHRKPGSM